MTISSSANYDMSIYGIVDALGSTTCADSHILALCLRYATLASGIQPGISHMAGNKLINLTDREKTLIHHLQAKYPLGNANQFINAAIRYYTPRALQGVDGNLDPLIADDQVAIKESLRELLDDVAKSYRTRPERIPWTDEQRAKFRQLIVVNPTIRADTCEWDGADWKIVK